jgi:hypothetical protein
MFGFNYEISRSLAEVKADPGNLPGFRARSIRLVFYTALFPWAGLTFVVDIVGKVGSAG